MEIVGIIAIGLAVVVIVLTATLMNKNEKILKLQEQIDEHEDEIASFVKQNVEKSKEVGIYRNKVKDLEDKLLKARMPQKEAPVKKVSENKKPIAKKPQSNKPKRTYKKRTNAKA